MGVVSAYYSAKNMYVENYRLQVETHDAWLAVMKGWHEEMKQQAREIHDEIDEKTHDRFYRSDFESFLENNPHLAPPPTFNER